MFKATCTWDNTTASRKITRTKIYHEESWQAGWHTPNTGISSKATLPSAWRDRCTTPVCCQLCNGANTSTLNKQAQDKLVHCEKNEMVLARAYQPPQRQRVDLACHHLETIWQEKTTRETSQAVESRPGANAGATRYGRGQHKTW